MSLSNDDESPQNNNIVFEVLKVIKVIEVFGFNFKLANTN